MLNRLSRTWIFLAIAASTLVPLNNSDAQTAKARRPWVKAHGYLDGRGMLKVERIKQRPAGDAYILEGIVETNPGNSAGYRIAGFRIVQHAGVKYAFINGAPASRKDVESKTRVKAIGAFDRNEFRAREVRIFQYSDDDDIEIEGPVQFVEQVNDEIVYRVGSLLLSTNTHELHQRTSGSNVEARAGLNRILRLTGKIKLSDNNQGIDIPEENLVGDNRRYGKLQTTLRSRFSTKIQFYTRLEFYWRDRIQSELEPSASDGFEFRLRDLYLSLNDLGGLKGLQVRLGRQRFRDARTWLMDRRLDAARIAYRRPHLGISFAASRALGERTTHADQLHFIGSAYGRFGKSFKATFYAIKENDDRPDRDDPLWLALQFQGRASNLVEWWAQGARYTSEDANNIARQGYGLDAGAILRPLGRKRGPFFSYHYAFGSADDPATDTKRERFRQPRLQLNYYKYGSNKRLYYYGRLMSPELSNLRFQAIGAGYKFSRRLTLQGILRSYQQINASRLVRGSNLGISPEGQSTDLGRSFEALLDLFPLKPLQITLSAEWFLPGDAFAPELNSVLGLSSELIFYF